MSWRKKTTHSCRWHCRTIGTHSQNIHFFTYFSLFSFLLHNIILNHIKFGPNFLLLNCKTFSNTYFTCVCVVFMWFFFWIPWYQSPFMFFLYRYLYIYFLLRYKVCFLLDLGRWSSYYLNRILMFNKINQESPFYCYLYVFDFFIIYF